jgi:hypothetical protein
VICRHLFLVFVAIILFSHAAANGQSSNVVIYGSEAPLRVGNWTLVSDSTAASGWRLSNPDAGVPKIQTPLSSPSNYVEFSFSPVAGIPYRLWIRGKAQGDSPYNDSVYVQFSGSVDSGGAPVYRINTTSATTINLEEYLDFTVRNWGWQDNGWGVNVLGPEIYFQSSGTQTLRIQQREDGISIDQIIVLLHQGFCGMTRL